MNTALKGACLAIYLLAVVATTGVLAPALASALQIIALLLLAGHLVELAVAFDSVKRYPGPLIDSIGLTLLFGLLHWRPLRQRP